MHLVSLQQAAGVEAHCVEFLSRALERHRQWSHGWINPDRGVHPFLDESVARCVSSTLHAKYRWGFKLPSRPAAVRAWHCRRELSVAGAAAVLIWNRTARNAFIVDAIGANRCIHWEHGGAWHPGRERERRAYLHSMPLLIANSHASARVLELLWEVRAPIEVCLNALRPSLRPAAIQPRRMPGDRAVRLGVAARLLPVKGLAVVLHAVAELAGEGHEVELVVAGAGVARPELERLAVRLGLARACRWLGAVDDMAAFYRSIDCLLHVPLTEAFGLVVLEASAHGCPVIAARVDGVPEALGEGGECLEPTLSLGEYAALGSSAAGVPPMVYDPTTDTLVEARAVSPAALARAVRELFAEDARYESASRAALSHVAACADFDAHIDQVMKAVGKQSSVDLAS